MLGVVKIKISGFLDKNWEHWFKDMDITYEGKNTIFTGSVKDEANLHGILNLIRDLNLKLISVHTLREKDEN